MKRGRKPDTIFITLLKGSAQCVVDRTDALVESVSAERTRESLSDLDDIEHRAGVNTASPEVAIDQCEAGRTDS